MKEFHIMFVPADTGMAKGENLKGDDEISVLIEWREANSDAEFIYIKAIQKT